ncbi:MAG: biotin transporter BioY [Actinomycetota bacterium]|nr:biotin transporter BioY [Actinomycetota bacterium]
MDSTAVALVRRPPRVLADLAGTAVLGDVLLVLAAAGFVGGLAQVVVHVPGTPVPVTGQTLGVLLAGSALGLRRGLAALLVYVALGFAGLPWFVGHTAGWQGPSTGYLFGFVLAGAVCGFLAERGGDRTMVRAVATMMVGEVAIYLVGVVWLAVDLHVGMGKAVALGFTPFVVGDAVKMALAAGLLPGAWWLAGRGAAGRSHRA